MLVVTTPAVTTTPARVPHGRAAWVAGARPRTLPLSVAPILVGVGAASAAGALAWWRAVAALGVSVLLQVGVNYANDYSDGVRGTDADRVGPARLTASGAVPAHRVLGAALASFAVAGVLGLVVAASTSWWVLAAGGASILAAWFYTGGRIPYGYRGFGDVSVFLFFGLVAVVGTGYVSLDRPRLTWLAVAAAIPVGLLAVAVLVVNNLRDIPRDRAAGKHTLAVQLGEGRTRIVYAAVTLAPFAISIAIAATGHPWAALSVAALPLAIVPVRSVLAGARDRALIPPLAASGKLALLYAALLAIGLAL